jgi:hypothetical protein
MHFSTCTLLFPSCSADEISVRTDICLEVYTRNGMCFDCQPYFNFTVKETLKACRNSGLGCFCVLVEWGMILEVVLCVVGTIEGLVRWKGEGIEGVVGLRDVS